MFLCGTFLNSEGKSFKADSLYVKGRYFEASIEFEREIFYAEDQSDINYYKYKKALCYKQLKDFERSNPVGER